MMNMNIEELDPNEEMGGEEFTSPGSTKFPIGVETDVTKDGGIKKTVIVEGSGWDTPQPGDEVSVHYVGTLAEDGTKFDSSRDRDSAFTFTIGQGSVIKGWDQGVATMRRGEKSKLRCASDYAYGSRGHPPTIPGGATLDFEVELLSWKSVNDLCGDGGVVKKTVREGEGYDRPGLEDEVCVSYVVRNLDSGAEVERTPEEGVEFTLGDGCLCPAVKIAVQNMKMNEEVELTVQPSYAFGDEGKGDALPGGTPVAIVLSLLSWKKVERVEKDGSIMKKTLREGEGYERPNEGASVTVRYVARLEDGTVFEERGEGSELTFTTDEEEVAACVDAAVMKMKKGERALVSSSSEWAFGAEGKAFEAVTVPPNARVTYEVEVMDFVKAKETWDMSKDEKVKEADVKREGGNKLFKDKKYVRAVKRYEKALSFLSYTDDFADEDKAAAKKIKLSCHLNVGACKLKLGDFKATRDSCQKALEIDGSNVKALFRRSQAFAGTKDFVEAIADLKKALEIEPQNKDVRSEYKRVRAEQTKQDKKEAGMYASMFKKMAAQTDDDDNADHCHGDDHKHDSCCATGACGSAKVEAEAGKQEGACKTGCC